MKIVRYKTTAIPPKELIDLLKEKYGSGNGFDLFLSEFKKAYKFCVGNENINFVPIAAYDNNEMVGHTALIVDKRLIRGDAFFGFLEVQRNKKMFTKLWRELVYEAKKQGIKVLKGPVNGSIWHQYRCYKKSNGEDYFKTELPTELYYYKYLFSNNPSLEINYYSAYRKKFDDVMRHIEKGYKLLNTSGFRIDELDQISMMDLQSIGIVSKKIFSKSWGYTELTVKEFLELYSMDKFAAHLSKLYLLYRDDEIIGYCSTVKGNESTLICKTICILPNYQGLGLGNALAYRVHVDARNQGYKKVIYALIREGNNIKNFPKNDAVIFREYAAFEFVI
ncbi:MAG: GNAT family N-acetyltransferase [Candidatus Levybacteria bacterium]|nr:GNAT family N-acetyltransferase [Candidatus Levybacteria bacterium]